MNILRSELAKAVKNEEFEKAAELRDRIKEISQSEKKLNGIR